MSALSVLLITLTCIHAPVSLLTVWVHDIALDTDRYVQVRSPDAAAAVFDTLLRFLRVSARTVIALGAVMALGVYLSGTGRLPRAVSGKADRMADSAARWGSAHGVHTGRVGTWTDSYRRWIALGVVLVLALVLALRSYPMVLTVCCWCSSSSPYSQSSRCQPPPAGPAGRPGPQTTLT